MAVESFLVMRGEALPTIEALQSEADRSGEPIILSSPVDLVTPTGFLPVRVQGRETGFEYYFSPSLDNALPPEAAQFGSYSILTRNGSDLEYGRAALLFMKVMARLTGERISILPTTSSYHPTRCRRIWRRRSKASTDL